MSKEQCIVSVSFAWWFKPAVVACIAYAAIAHCDAADTPLWRIARRGMRVNVRSHAA